MEMLLSQLINGLQIGTIYALIALGYTMVYGIIKLINFAHGDIIMIGAYVAFISVTTYKLPILAAFFLAMVFCGILNILIERIAYRPLRQHPRLEALITAIGVSLLLENGARFLPFMGPDYRLFPNVIPLKMSQITKNVAINNIQIINISVAILLMVILYVIIKYTKTGRAMRATAMDPGAASLMGININSVISLAFFIGGSYAGAAGVLMAITYPQLNPYMGIMPGLKAFVAAVFGGIGSVPGAMLGGLLMGVIETYATQVNSQSAQGVFFVIMIIVLLFRPTGLLGEPIQEKV
jgi:branched-chain amino acid transport system permease protein